MKFSYSITCAVMRQPPASRWFPRSAAAPAWGPAHRPWHCRSAGAGAAGSDSSRSRPSCARASRPPGSGCAPCPARASAASRATASSRAFGPRIRAGLVPHRGCASFRVLSRQPLPCFAVSNRVSAWAAKYPSTRAIRSQKRARASTAWDLPFPEREARSAAPGCGRSCRPRWSHPSPRAGPAPGNRPRSGVGSP